jgi:hypothetical protein
MSQLIERLREAHDNFAGLEGVSNDDLVAVLDAAAALTQPPSPVAAGGYVLVPVEPTEAMIEAAVSPYRHGNTQQFDDAMRATVLGYYRAMLSARPSIGEPVPGAGNGEHVLIRREDAEDARDLLMLYGSNSNWRELSERIGQAVAAAPPIAATQEGEAP